MLRQGWRFWRSRDGLAAVEFAFILPVLLVLLCGSIEVTNALECRQKVISATSSISSIVAMTTSVSASDISNVYAAGNSILYPFPTNNTAIVISSIVYSSATNKDVVQWSVAQNATPLVTNTVMSVPAGVITATNGDGAILVQVTHNYTSPWGHFLVGTFPMGATFWSRPRESASVACNGC
ncbi:MAG TPA: TadE/TadG family type IV pilus assembly protein [Rhizomicrobium sp.]|jgi:Flp pilus assembly protein TadG|nr:TadE/TadG family type IV pilus assembly protein [Rhizomicrobium sp.]